MGTNNLGVNSTHARGLSMRTILTLLTVTCLVTGCSNQASNTETAGSDTGRSQAESDSKSESAKTPPETPSESSTSEQTAAASTDSKPLVIDVRTQAEWDEGHLDIATHIPLDQITNRIVEVAPNKDQKVYLHCRSGGRSGQAKVELEGLGFTNVENVGGLEDARARFESGND
jgi:phage shock protein E